MYFSLCFTCPARFCEITEDKDDSIDFLKNLVSQMAESLPLSATIENVMLNYSEKEHMYYVRIFVHTFMIFENDAPDQGDMTLLIEGYISQVLLQCFWEVNAFGC